MNIKFALHCKSGNLKVRFYQSMEKFGRYFFAKNRRTQLHPLQIPSFAYL